jgi:hypothetical protein
MSQAIKQNNVIALDVFGRDDSGAGGFSSNSKSASVLRFPSNRSVVSEDVWAHALRRHVNARENWRNLLDRFVKPHH